MSKKLKPCPFCGGEATFAYFTDEDECESVSVICSNCSAHTSWFNILTIGIAGDRYGQKDYRVVARIAWNNGIIYFPRCEIPWCAMYRTMNDVQGEEDDE